MSLLPIFLKLEGRCCLLVGAGHVALDKIGSLLATGVQLRVIAPEALPDVRRLAEEGRIEWIQREFAPDDIDGNSLVIAATDVPDVNAAVYREAVERGILANSVDDIPNCDFFFGSVVSRGSLQVAISTGGESPAVAQRLRREIDAQLPEDLGPWLENLGQLRREVIALHPRGEARKNLLHQLAHRPLCASATCPSRRIALAPLCNSDELRNLEELASHKRRASGHDFSRAATAPRSAGASAPEGKVYLVGAGPGDPDLLTVKALRLIQSANVVLHDDLVPKPILDLAPAYAVVVNVGKRCGAKSITQDEINALMIEHACANRIVVRLKSGDPLIFGRAAEEMAALAEAGVLFEVVPGITAALAAAAAIGCSLTDRNSASNVTFSTGHHAQSHNESPLPEIEDATRVVYMPGRDLSLLAQEWLQQGLPADFPCAVVSHAAQPDQQVHHTTLGALGESEPALAPSLLIAGWAVRQIAANACRAEACIQVTV
jgi:uroporphyrin-III C-methyltransferase